jgi:hypothetical protein
MADRAPLQLTIHDCPAEEAAAVLAVLDAYDVHLEFADIEPQDALHTATRYMQAEAAMGDDNRVASALIAAAPHCSFVIWQDPKDVCDGQVVMYHPALGRFDGDCNAFGEPHATIDVVWAVAGECGVDRGAVTAAAFLDTLCRRLGQPWREVLATADHHVIVAALRAAA